MLCFCDIPLSEINLHTKKYGSFGIGVSKKWAGDNNITPVLYAHYKSDVYKRIYKYSKKITTPHISEGQMPFEEYILYRVKRTSESKSEHDFNYYNKGKSVKLYNEREWRFVPKITSEIHLEEWHKPECWESFSITNKRNNKSELCNQLSERTKGKKLKIEPADIKYLFVPNDEERKELIDEILKISSLEDIEKNYLISKIIALDNFKKDV